MKSFTVCMCAACSAYYMGIAECLWDRGARDEGENFADITAANVKERERKKDWLSRCRRRQDAPATTTTTTKRTAMM